jgi:hypothetical protein
MPPISCLPNSFIFANTLIHTTTSTEARRLHHLLLWYRIIEGAREPASCDETAGSHLQWTLYGTYDPSPPRALKLTVMADGPERPSPDATFSGVDGPCPSSSEARRIAKMGEFPLPASFTANTHPHPDILLFPFLSTTFLSTTFLLTTFLSTTFLLTTFLSMNKQITTLPRQDNLLSHDQDHPALYPRSFSSCFLLLGCNRPRREPTSAHKTTADP